MPAGLQTFDAAGSLQLEISDRVYRILSIHDIPTTTTGSISIAVPATEGVVRAIPTRLNVAAEGPAITVSGSTLSWDYGSVPSGSRDSSLQLALVAY